MNNTAPENYDGFYFTSDKNKNLIFHFFEKKHSEKNLKRFENKYHIGLYTIIANKKCKLELFEAILGDAFAYASNLTGLNIAGILLKKTQTSYLDWQRIIFDINKKYIGDGYELCN